MQVEMKKQTLLYTINSQPGPVDTKAVLRRLRNSTHEKRISK